MGFNSAFKGLNGEIIRVWQMIITDKRAYENSKLAIC